MTVTSSATSTRPSQHQPLQPPPSTTLTKATRDRYGYNDVMKGARDAYEPQGASLIIFIFISLLNEFTGSPCMLSSSSSPPRHGPHPRFKRESVGFSFALRRRQWCRHVTNPTLASSASRWGLSFALRRWRRCWHVTDPTLATNASRWGHYMNMKWCGMPISPNACHLGLGMSFVFLLAEIYFYLNLWYVCLY